jgi:hypothetical protein
MEESSAILAPTEYEIAAGFSAQTLSYPDRYELPRLGSNKKPRLERAVALELDVNNRIKRCKTSDGYVHEFLVDGEWSEHHKFSTLDDVLQSDLYGGFRRKDDQKSFEVEYRD